MIYLYRCNSCGIEVDYPEPGDSAGMCHECDGEYRRVWGTFQVDPRATPNRRHVLPSDPRKINWISKNEPSWEKGVSGERRADGSFMPYLDKEGQLIRVKAYGEQRHELEDARRKLAQTGVSQ